MGVAAEERRQLSLLLDRTGPDAPTLCEGWLTRDLAAHLVVRESRPDAALGILLPPLAAYTQRVQDGIAAQPWARLVDRVRRGPAWYWPTSIGALDELTNSAEFLVHHEDVRRGRPGWEPRPADPVRDAAAWNAARRTGKLSLRKVPVGVRLRTTDGRETVAKSGAEEVTVTGDPVELLLFVFGRDAVQVSFDGDPGAVDRLQAAGRGI
ncbi:TIGR03085 family metal-binding protein [Amycolatopsis endophytica]|uniref:Uncharacterized protein (TIGR03085 family) n=1 Tax=Amycolatopsis endophytica TaxID=860233 RepID=A0A853B815_9PSEU|nr:TIGR03085 family metal-binding protein [Amycolatopsis endophytica]NYI91249.1 uncharacterized protein (TIGR03085 family) [Amycolatopsis endophytica]